ncbi:MAG: 2,3-bisphosphoglycerate-independent phosphoglycerate mutase [Bacteroidetes bacterium]|nr:2,3-bisphosphoglycerate-independent phosphoglycerate mutase [Bacteroidota bacterium]
MTSEKVMLIIMDGWGHGTQPASDAIYRAEVPYIRSLYGKYPHTTLRTDGEYVGLPDGQMGNSEVGHMNIGAGRVVYQELVRINRAMLDGTLTQNERVQQLFAYCIHKDKTLHLMGLVSDGGVHAHHHHLHALIREASNAGIKRIRVHAFTDGRDTDPQSGYGFLKELDEVCRKYKAEWVSVVGRYYAMDRDNRWERIRKAYDMLVHREGAVCNDLSEAVRQSYTSGVTDEFILPLIKAGVDGAIHDGDAVLCFNFRTDRCREITKALTQEAFPEQQMKPLSLHYVTMTNYDASFRNVVTIFDNDDLRDTLGEILEQHHKTQVRIAETEKYPHVTFFFSGGREKEFKGETRILRASPKVATYDLQPEMSAFLLKDAIMTELKSSLPDFICLNFANADMVGHTGVMQAVIQAVQTVDSCVKAVTEFALEKGYTVLITADHGNADYMINDDGSPNTAHTTNPVPLFLVSNHIQKELKPGKLGDLAPTILELMHIQQPSLMTGESLLA